MPPKTRRDSALRTTYMGAAGGLIAGLLLGIFSWFYYQAIPQPGMSYGSHAGLGGFLSTLSIFMVGHTFVGAIISALIMLVSAVVRKRLPAYVVASLVFSISVGVYALVFFVLRGNFALPASVSLSDPVRNEILKQSVFYGVAALLVALFLALVSFRRLRSPRVHAVLGILLVLSLVYYGIGLIRINSGGLTYRTLSDPRSVQTERGNKVVVIGLDGGTWQVLEPFMDEGLLPNIKTLYESGATANLVTHGRRLSPSVWTGIATGYSHSAHGIMGWTLPDPSTGATRLVQSGDRRKPALWQIVSSYGKSSVVLNWIASYPAEEIDGAVISRVLDVDSLAVYPPELAPRVFSLVDSSFSRMSEREWYYGEIEAVFDLAENLAAGIQPDLLMLYINCTDKAQHRHWAAFQPEKFDKSWGVTDEDIETGLEVLRSVWSAVDDRIGRLLRVVDDDTAILLVSDHGFRPRAQISALPMVNRILHKLGHLRWSDPDRELIDFKRSQAFVAGLDAYDAMVGVYVNARGRLRDGIVAPDSVDILARQIAHELSSLRVDETGEPLFLSVGLLSEGGPKRLRNLGYDVYAEKSVVLRTAPEGLHVTIAGEKHELEGFFRIMRGNSGSHAPRGVVIASGPQFNSDTRLPLCADSPYSIGLTFVTGYSAKREWIYGPLRRLGFLDSYTSIDVAPTVLYLLDLPFAEAMDGRPMEGIIAPDLASENAAESVADFDFVATGQAEAAGKPSEQTLDQLKALGYIQ